MAVMKEWIFGFLPGLFLSSIPKHEKKSLNPLKINTRIKPLYLKTENSLTLICQP